MLLVLVVLAIGVVVGVAYGDHRHKTAVMLRLELGEWYCVHEGTRCGEGSSERIERRWNERELGYKTSSVVLACGAAVLLVGTLRRRR